MAAAKRGRPRLTDEQAAERAAHILDVALKVRQGRERQLEQMGYTPAQAWRLVAKRHRGRIGEFIGSSVSDLFPRMNADGAAAAAVLLLEKNCAAAGDPISRAKALTHVLKWYSGHVPDERSAVGEPHAQFWSNLRVVSRANLTRALAKLERDATARAALVSGCSHRDATELSSPI